VYLNRSSHHGGPSLPLQCEAHVCGINMAKASNLVIAGMAATVLPTMQRRSATFFHGDRTTTDSRCSTTYDGDDDDDDNAALNTAPQRMLSLLHQF